MTNGLFDHNRRVLDGWRPGLFQQILDAPAPAVPPAPGGSPGDPVEDLARGQAYFATPFRFNLRLGTGQGLYGTCTRFHERLHELAPPSLEASRFAPNGLGALIVLGAGFGPGVLSIAETLRPPFLLIGVTSLAEFRPWLEHVDWARVRALVDGGTRLLIKTAPDEHRLGTQIRLALRDFGWAGDGAWMYRATEADLWKTLANDIIRRYGEALSNDGFFEDECTMYANGVLGLGRRAVPWLTRAVATTKPVPALIVGSGPSLDGDLDALRRLKESCIVISCGTGLGVLLRNDIRPDLHIEMENDPKVVEVLDRLNLSDAVRQVPAFLPTSIHPDVPARFDRVIGFFRGSITPEHLIKQPGEGPMALAYPLVGNAGAALAAWLGFYDVVLFGIDCGTKLERAHSRFSVYDGTVFTDLDQSTLTDRLPGNFGGEVRADRIYRLSVDHFALLAGLDKKRRFINVSDGAHIPGFIPVPSAKLTLPPNPEGRARALAAILDQDVVPAPPRITPAALAAMESAFSELMAHMRNIVRLAPSPLQLFLAYGDLITQYEALDGGAKRAAYSLVGGSLRKYAASLVWFINRVPEPDAAAFFAAARAALVEAIVGLEAEALELMAEVRAGRLPPIK